MKTIFKTPILLAFIFGVYSTSLNAQIEKNDTICKINGEIIAVKIVNTTTNDITFSRPGETLTETLPKNLIKEITYSNGRKEKVSEMIIIKGEEDWEKVKLTSIPEDVAGLVKKGDIQATKTNLGLYTPAKKVKPKLEAEIKKEAAKIGAHIVLITSTTPEGMNYRLAGSAYGYK